MPNLFPMRLAAILAGLFALLVPARADPPPAEDARAQLDALYAELAAAPDATAAAPLAAEIEAHWARSGSDTIDLLMSRGDSAYTLENFSTARVMYDAAIELMPGFAEAWVSRAAVNLAEGAYEQALVDVRRALAIEPRHYGALQILARLLDDMKDARGALAALEAARKVHPHLDGIDSRVRALDRKVRGRPT